MAGKIIPEKTVGGYAFASNLRHPHANLADHKVHSKYAFAEALTEHSDDLIIEQVPAHMKIRDIPEFELDMVSLKCPNFPNCPKEVQNTTELLDHYFTHQPIIQRYIYVKTEKVTKEINVALEHAYHRHHCQSFAKRRIENSRYIVKCKLKSPLASFISLNHMKVYGDNPPRNTSTLKHKCVKIELDRPEGVITLFFAFTWIEKSYLKIRNAQKKKWVKHMWKTAMNQCQTFELSDEDLFNKKNRTDEETDCLAKALDLPEDFTQEMLQVAILGLKKTSTRKRAAPTSGGGRGRGRPAKRGRR